MVSFGVKLLFTNVPLQKQLTSCQKHPVKVMKKNPVTKVHLLIELQKK